MIVWILPASQLLDCFGASECCLWVAVFVWSPEARMARSSDSKGGRDALGHRPLRAWLCSISIARLRATLRLCMTVCVCVWSGGYVNPLLLVKRIPRGMRVERLRDRLRAIMSDYRYVWTQGSIGSMRR
jgi:hypothetical protein